MSSQLYQLSLRWSRVFPPIPLMGQGWDKARCPVICVVHCIFRWLVASSESCAVSSFVFPCTESSSALLQCAVSRSSVSYSSIRIVFLCSSFMRSVLCSFTRSVFPCSSSGLLPYKAGKAERSPVWIRNMICSRMLRSQIPF